MLTREDAKQAQGVAILAMVALHLFCRLDMNMYNVHIAIRGVPLLYYLGLFGDICVPIYCFTSGYAQILLYEKEKQAYFRNGITRVKRLLDNYWAVVIAFAIVGLIKGDPDIPGSFPVLLRNLLLYRSTYNGAWWFVFTYILLVLCGTGFVKAVKKLHPVMTIGISGVLYFVSYILYFQIDVKTTNEMLNWAVEQFLLFGRCQFSFVVGMLYYANDVVGFLRRNMKKGLRTVMTVLVPLCCFLAHCKVQSLIVAPVTGIATITCFHLWEKGKWTRRFFAFWGAHSTNIWLVHMFFYLFLFKGFVYRFREPILVYAALLGISVLVSYGIKGLLAGLNLLREKIKRKRLTAAKG